MRVAVKNLALSFRAQRLDNQDPDHMELYQVHADRPWGELLAAGLGAGFEVVAFGAEDTSDLASYRQVDLLTRPEDAEGMLRGAGLGGRISSTWSDLQNPFQRIRRELKMRCHHSGAGRRGGHRSRGGRRSGRR